MDSLKKQTVEMINSKIIEYGLVSQEAMDAQYEANLSKLENRVLDLAQKSYESSHSLIDSCRDKINDVENKLTNLSLIMMSYHDKLCYIERILRVSTFSVDKA